jgi:hypothetical protein
MNTAIAQLVALTCHANAFLQGSAMAKEFFPNNSTCTFCERISFVEPTRSFSGKLTEELVAGRPDEWFSYLAKKNGLGVRLVRQPQNDLRLSERMSAGFVGGGGDWALAARLPGTTESWTPRWEVWNHEAPEQRIWRVTYVRSAAEPGETSSQREDLQQAASSLKSALIDIEAFSRTHDCHGFTESFGRALDSLEGRSRHGYHGDLVPEGSSSSIVAAVLDAAQSAWVFGGMGSWNDMAFAGEDGKEYERVSEKLFNAINAAICAAANETDAA